MRLDEARFNDIVLEVVEENPLAIRAALKILRTEFTDSVPTLAVTLEKEPRLLVNLAFLREHCETAEHVKACLAHEFLHVLLGHTERFKKMDAALNIALDAVINAVIHRTMGEAASSFFARYYRDSEGVMRLLRPMRPAERASQEWRAKDRRRSSMGWRDSIADAWADLYRGALVADDVLDIASEARSGWSPRGRATDGAPVFIGNHDEIGRELPEALKEALDRTMVEMDGSGLWRSPKDRGAGALPSQMAADGASAALERWRRRTFEVLRRAVAPDPRSRLTESSPVEYRVPVLSPRDRRAFLRATWSPILPEAEWLGNEERPLGTACVYLDVSGSMHLEMPHVISLLSELRSAIRTPFWAFSDVVAPAVIRGGRLHSQTTGGTSMACVLEHLARTRPPAAVVVTDGYIERLERRQMKAVEGIRLHAILTRGGSPSALADAGIPYTQLEEVPGRG